MAKSKLGLVRGKKIDPGLGTQTGGQAESKKPDKGSGGKGSKEKKLGARKRVHNAQLQVLEDVEKILKGNCGSAKKGNHSCAKFVLDWALVSDLRSPLAKPLKQKSLKKDLLKRLKQVTASEGRTVESM